MADIIQHPITDVFLFALITALATGLGALPFFFIKEMPRKWLGISNAVAAGLMLAASFNLIYEGWSYNQWMVVGGVLLGLLFIIGSEKILNQKDDVKFAHLPQADARKTLLILGIMTLHSFTEGVSVGVSFSGGLSLATFITTAIAIHNIPEGLAISLVMVPRGSTAGEAALWSIFSSLPQPLMAVPAYLFVETFRTYLPMGLGFAAGAMIWMIFAELIPDANEETDTNTVATVITFSVITMLAFQILIQ